MADKHWAIQIMKIFAQNSGQFIKNQFSMRENSDLLEFQALKCQAFRVVQL